MAAYRRFASDYVSRRYGYIKRFLRDAGCRQLLGARSGYGGSGNPWSETYLPFDLGAGAVHLDYIGPEAWGLSGSSQRFLSAGFITAYARGMSDGKPVAWMEYGRSVGATPSPIDLSHQAEVYRQTLAMIENSRAAAAFVWWYPGGYRVEEKSDYGWVHPDGTLRPAGEELQRFVHSRRFASIRQASWKGQETEAEDGARSLSSLWKRHAPSFNAAIARDQMEEIRPFGFGRMTTDMPLLTPGGGAHSNPAPWACANAEWGRIASRGKTLERQPGAEVVAHLKDPLELELINTGAARWRASETGVRGSVWIHAEHPQRGVQWIKVPSTAYGKSCDISWIPTDIGPWTLRPHLMDLGGFGEPLSVRVDGS